MKLCERFGCLPSVLLAEDSELLRLVDIADRGRIETPGDDLGAMAELDAMTAQLQALGL